MAAAKENAIAANERMALPPFNLRPLYQSRPLITRAVLDGGKKTAPSALAEGGVDASKKSRRVCRPQQIARLLPEKSKGIFDSRTSPSAGAERDGEGWINPSWESPRWYSRRAD